MKIKLGVKLKILIPSITNEVIEDICNISILDTKFSPTINLNKIFENITNNIELQQKVQHMLLEIMEELIGLATEKGLSKSFFLLKPIQLFQ